MNKKLLYLNSIWILLLTMLSTAAFADELINFPLPINDFKETFPTNLQTYPEDDSWLNQFGNDYASYCSEQGNIIFSYLPTPSAQGTITSQGEEMRFYKTYMSASKTKNGYEKDGGATINYGETFRISIYAKSYDAKAAFDREISSEHELLNKISCNLGEECKGYYYEHGRDKEVRTGYSVRYKNAVIVVTGNNPSKDFQATASSLVSKMQRYDQNTEGYNSNSNSNNQNANTGNSNTDTTQNNLNNNQNSCDNNRQDSGEEGIDCGGVCPYECEEDTCFNGIKDNGEDAVDCGGDCTPCMLSIKLDQEKFFTNFNGSEEVTISGKALIGTTPAKNEKIKIKLLDSRNKLISQEGRFSKNELMTKDDGTFSVTYSVPKASKALLKDDYVDIQLITKGQNPVVYLHQIEYYPEIVGFKRIVTGPLKYDVVQAGSWETFEFEVFDLNEDVDKIIIKAMAGGLKWTNNGEVLKTGSDKNLFEPVVLVGDYDNKNKKVKFGLLTPKMGLEFDADLLQKIKESFVGTKPSEDWFATDRSVESLSALKGAVGDKLVNDMSASAKATFAARIKDWDFGSFRTTGLDKNTMVSTSILGNKNDGGARLSNALKQANRLGKYSGLSKAVDALDYTGRAVGAVKMGMTVGSSFNTITNEITKMQTHNLGAIEKLARGMRASLEAFSIAEGAIGLTGESVVGFKGTNLMQAGKAITYGLGVNVAKGSLDYITDIYEEARAEDRHKNIMVAVQAVDKQGHRSKIAIVRVPVIYQSSEPSELEI